MGGDGRCRGDRDRRKKQIAHWEKLPHCKKVNRVKFERAGNFDTPIASVNRRKFLTVAQRSYHLKFMNDFHGHCCGG